jgi:hypothetical protein
VSFEKPSRARAKVFAFLRLSALDQVQVHLGHEPVHHCPYSSSTSYQDSTSATHL